MLKKIIAVVVIILLLSFGMSALAANETKIIFNDQEVECDVSPQIIDGCLLVPLRTIFEAWGAEVNWYEIGKRIEVIKGDMDITVHLDSYTVTFYQGIPIQRNGWGSPIAGDYGKTTIIGLDTSPTIVNGRTLVPAQFIAEALGMSVEWDYQNNLVRIKEKDAAEPESAGTELPMKDFPGYIVFPKICDLDSEYSCSGYSEEEAVSFSKHGIEKSFQPQTDKVIIEFEANVSPYVWGFGLMDKSGQKTALDIRCDDNFYPVEGYTKLFCDLAFLKEFDMNKSAKVKVKIVADIENQKADIYLDDQLILENQDFVEEVQDIGMCIMSDSNIALKSIQSNDGELAAEDISNYTLEYKNVEGITDQNINGVKAFDPQTGKISIELDYKLYGGGFALMDEFGQKTAFIIEHEPPHMHYSGTNLNFIGGKACSGLFLNDWELPESDGVQTIRLKLIADIAAQSVDVYVNDKKQLVNADFLQRVDSFGTCVLYGDAKIVSIKKIE